MKRDIIVGALSGLLVSSVLWLGGAFKQKVTESNEASMVKSLLEEPGFSTMVVDAMASKQILFRGEKGDAGPVGPVGPAGNVPIGTILAWDKNFGSCSGLIDTSIWVECNGQLLIDKTYSQSPLFGLRMPELNESGRFLRGARVSHVEQAEATREHWHYVAHKVDREEHKRLSEEPNQTIVQRGDNDGDANYAFKSVDEYADAGRTSTVGMGDTETRPLNMSVVWIMRVQ